ncbi:unnamed protein product [Ixodes persulcatus]
MMTRPGLQAPYKPTQKYGLGFDSSWNAVQANDQLTTVARSRDGAVTQSAQWRTTSGQADAREPPRWVRCLQE